MGRHLLSAQIAGTELRKRTRREAVGVCCARPRGLRRKPSLERRRWTHTVEARRFKMWTRIPVQTAIWLTGGIGWATVNAGQNRRSSPRESAAGSGTSNARVARYRPSRRNRRCCYWWWSRGGRTLRMQASFAKPRSPGTPAWCSWTTSVQTSNFSTITNTSRWME